MLITDHQPVRIAVERNANIGAIVTDRLGHGFGMGRAAIGIDVHTIGRNTDRNHLCTQLIEGRRGDLIGRTIGAIDHHPHARKAEVPGEGRLDDFDITGLSIVNAPDSAKTARRGKALLQALIHQGLDLQFMRVRKLVAVGAKQLDAIIGKVIVRGRDHHANIGAHGAGHHGHSRRRQGAEQAHIHTHAGKARHKSRFDHIAGQPGVLADHHQMAPVPAALEQLARRKANPQGDFGGHGMAIGFTANTVSSKIGALGHGDEKSEK